MQTSNSNLESTTQSILDCLQTDADPLDLIQADAAGSSSSTSAPHQDNSPSSDQTSSNPPLDLAALHPSIPPPPAEGPVRHRKKRRTTHADTIHEKYDKALQLVKSGTPMHDATKATGLPKSTFYKWKPVAEMKIIDVDQFTHFLETNMDKDVTGLLNMCKLTLVEELYVGIAKNMRKSGDLL